MKSVYLTLAFSVVVMPLFLQPFIESVNPWGWSLIDYNTGIPGWSIALTISVLYGLITIGMDNHPEKHILQASVVFTLSLWFTFYFIFIAIVLLGTLMLRVLAEGSDVADIFTEHRERGRGKVRTNSTYVPNFEEFVDMPFPGMRNGGSSPFQGNFTVDDQAFDFNGNPINNGNKEQEEVSGTYSYTYKNDPPPKSQSPPKQQPPPPKSSFYKAYVPRPDPPSKTPKVDKAFEKFRDRMERMGADSHTIIKEGASLHPDRHPGEPQYEEIFKRVSQLASEKKRQERRK